MGGGAGTDPVCPCFADSTPPRLLHMWPFRSKSVPSPEVTVQVPPQVLERLASLEEMVRSIRAHMGSIEEWRDDLNTAVAEGIQHVTRAENRIKATVRRAREQLADVGLEHPGLEAEAAELFARDDARGGEGAVPPMSANVEDDPRSVFAGFPGAFSVEHARYLTGR